MTVSKRKTQQAHALIIDRKPDLILLDWMLPGIGHRTGATAQARRADRRHADHHAHRQRRRGQQDQGLRSAPTTTSPSPFATRTGGPAEGRAAPRDIGGQRGAHRDRRPAARPGQPPSHHRRQTGRDGPDRIPPAAVLHDPPGTRLHPQPAADQVWGGMSTSRNAPWMYIRRLRKASARPTEPGADRTRHRLSFLQQELSAPP